MKFPIALTALLVLVGCVSAAEYDTGNAYAKCDAIKVPTSRDRCIAEAIAQSERERQREAQAQQERIEEAEARELNRVIAGAEKD